MKYREHPVVFACAGERLLGILAEPDEPCSIGVIVLVGGPQYRAGSHRQFVLLARHLAERGHPVFRFDYRGMGDSTGAVRTFEEIDADIACAIAAFTARLPAMHSLVLWGLCDAASAAMINAPKHALVKALVLLNPWAWAEETHAQTRLRHYYLSRFCSLSFWHKLVTGRVRLGDSTRSLAKTVAIATRGDDPHPDYRRAMAEGLDRFRGRVLLILSGRDLTAKEFLRHVGSQPEWTPLLSAPRAERLDVPDADHTFSTRAARDRVADGTADFLRRLARESGTPVGHILERSQGEPNFKLPGVRYPASGGRALKVEQQ
jgi:exosortase A-associated hydrolase 1